MDQGSETSFILSRPSRRKLKQSGILRERVFGCDLAEHLLNSGHEIPMVLKCCSEFIECHGIVDGIYRLSGITSNIQKLRNAFDEERIPDLYGDESILQDIHCVSSVLKMYFRELPSPLLTYQLYDKFVMAVMQNENVRLFNVRDVVQQLPPPHYRTLEYLIQHLARVASHSGSTGMTPRNIAIVWAPNLLRSKDLEKGGVAALQDVGTQAVVTEYLVRYVDLIFSDKIPIFSTSSNETEGTPKKLRPKSLAISTPTKLLSIDEARNRALTAIKNDQKYIEVGGGPENLPKTYHTVINLPNRKGGSLKQKKSPHGWKTLFSKNRHQRKGSTLNDISFYPSDSVVVECDTRCHMKKSLRPVKSVESLVSTPPSQSSNRNSIVENASKENESLEGVTHGRKGSINSECSSVPSPRTHSRSVSHDSYFNNLEKKDGVNVCTSAALKEERESDSSISPEISKIFLDISELNLEFNTSEAEMKIFSEDETLKSTSVEYAFSRSSDDVRENISLTSDLTSSKENLNRFEKRSLKDKLKKRFVSPSQRKESGLSDSSEDSRTNSLKRVSSVLKDKLVQTLSPETLRKKEASLIQLNSGSTNTILKKFERVKDPICINEERSLEDYSVSGLDSQATKVFVHDRDEIKERLSIESFLIDQELLDKITRMRVSPSVRNSEDNSVSLVEAIMSDNKSFTLGNNNTEVSEVGGEIRDLHMSDRSTLPQSLHAIPSASSSTVISNLEFKNEISEREISLKFSEDNFLSIKESVNSKLIKSIKDRPNSLLEIPHSDSCGFGSSLTSPETPQGDSNFLDIQYHPLSDTTEPSTPSDSHFTGNIGRGTKETPQHSSPLSPDLSSSSPDESVGENGLFYENIVLTTSASLSNFTNLSILSQDLQEYNSKFDSQVSTPTVQKSELEYENVILEPSVCSGKDSKIFNSNSVTPCYENLEKSSASEYVGVSQDGNNDIAAYANVNIIETRDKNENLTENLYEECAFNHHSEFENITFLNDKFEAQIEGKELYKQFKFLAKSIHETNKILKENSETTPLQDLSLQTSNVSICQSSLHENIKEERQNSETNVYSGCLDSPVTPSSSNLITELLVLPSFSSPTESTIQETTLPSEDFESQNSPKVAYSSLPHSSEKDFLLSLSKSCTTFIPTLSPPSPDLRELPLMLSPLVSPKASPISINLLPRPISGQKQMKILPPVPKPRNLPDFNVDPILSPTSSLSSLDSTEKNFNTSDETILENLQKPNIVTNPKNIIDLVNMPYFKSKDSSKLPEQSVIRYPTHSENKVKEDDVKLSTDNDTFTIIDSGVLDFKEEDEAQKRERIEKYKEERRSFLRKKFKSESFKGERDDMLIRLKQKAISPSRHEDNERLLDYKIKDNRHQSSKSNNIHNLKSNENNTLDRILVACQRSDLSDVETFHICSLPKANKESIFQRSLSQDSKVFVDSGKSICIQNLSQSSKSDNKCNIKTFDSFNQNKSNDDINVKERVAIWSRQKNMDLNINKKNDSKISAANLKITQNSNEDLNSKKLPSPLLYMSEKENTSEFSKLSSSWNFSQDTTKRIESKSQTTSFSPIQDIPASLNFKFEKTSKGNRELQSPHYIKRHVLFTQKSESNPREQQKTLKTRSYSVGSGSGSSLSSAATSPKVICSQQPSRIKDMKELFEKNSNQDLKNTIIRQASMEEISN